MINRNQAQPIRTGVIASFTNLEALDGGFSKAVSLLPAFEPKYFAEPYGAGAQAPNIVNVVLRIFEEEADKTENEWNQEVVSFINHRADILDRHGIRRVSIDLGCRGLYPIYYTLRDNDRVWKEEQAIRNIEPA